jgi:hypothetical protein
MTHRSIKQHPKTTTISRRLRNRVNQDLSAQPAEISQLRNVHPRRTTAQPALDYDPTSYQSPESHRTSLDWEAATVAQHSTHSLFTHIGAETSTDVLETQDPLLRPDYIQNSQGGRNTVDEPRAPPYHSPNSASPSRPDPSQPRSVSDSHNFELSFAEVHEQPLTPYIELQDMRYVLKYTHSSV